MNEDETQAGFDARFREIIAHYDTHHDTDDDVVTPAESLPPQQQRGADLLIPAQWRIPDADSPREHVLDEQAGFTPPEPRPLPSDDPMFWTTTICLVGGPLWALYLFLFDRYARGLWWTLAAGMFFVGLVLLFLHQPASRDEMDDDGAVL